MTDKTGQCACGAVKFQVRNVKTDIGACHCKICQRWAGSALLAFTVPDGTIEFEGSKNINTYSSSEWAERAWCNKCGSGIWYRVTADGPYKNEYHIPVGLLDDTSGMKMNREIFTDSKIQGFSFGGDIQSLNDAETWALMAPKSEEG